MWCVISYKIQHCMAQPDISPINFVNNDNNKKSRAERYIAGYCSKSQSEQVLLLPVKGHYYFKPWQGCCVMNFSLIPLPVLPLAFPGLMHSRLCWLRSPSPPHRRLLPGTCCRWEVCHICSPALHGPLSVLLSVRERTRTQDFCSIMLSIMLAPHVLQINHQEWVTPKMIACYVPSLQTQLSLSLQAAPAWRVGLSSVHGPCKSSSLLSHHSLPCLTQLRTSAQWMMILVPLWKAP